MFRRHIGSDITDGYGRATLQYIYPTGGVVYAFNCSVVAGESPQGVVCKPVQLSVAKHTKLSLTVDKADSSYTHFIRGKLSNMTGAGVENKEITIKINATATGDFSEYVLNTTSTGEFSLEMTLKPNGVEVADYLISAFFDGEYTCCTEVP